MFHPSHRLRRCRGMTLIELLVVMAIIGVLAGLLTSAVFRAMDAANALRCTNNLRNLGLALHMYQDAKGHYPCEAESNECFYVGLLDFVEAGYLQDRVRQQGAQAAQPVRVFLCPSRRDVVVGAKSDYAYGSNPGNNLSSILGGEKPVPLSMVTAADGTGNTLLLSHKGVGPNAYNGSGPNDSSWAARGEHGRDPNRLVRDRNEEEMSKLIGSPHVLAVPSLFADSSVRKIPYESSSVEIEGLPFMTVLWSYNDGKGLGRHAP